MKYKSQNHICFNAVVGTKPKALEYFNSENCFLVCHVINDTRGTPLVLYLTEGPIATFYKMQVSNVKQKKCRD